MKSLHSFEHILGFKTKQSLAWTTLCYRFSCQTKHIRSCETKHTLSNETKKYIVVKLITYSVWELAKLSHLQLNSVIGEN